jgi:hypothetical protein
MSESLVRGYLVSKAATFVSQTAASRGMPDPGLEFSPPLRSALPAMTPVGWYPVEYIGEINRAIAEDLGGNDEARARAELENCGRFLANEATNTFMKLLMKVLTPALFAKKLPDLWRRDCTYGQLELDVGAGSMTLRLSGMEGHDHIAAVMPGYVGFALERMGKVIERAEVVGWSLSNPTAGASIQFTWKT